MIFQVAAAENDYDEYDAFIVRAGSADDALALASKMFEKYQLKGLTVTEVLAGGEPGIILGSYNAG